jgi:hypothetical protein
VPQCKLCGGPTRYNSNSSYGYDLICPNCEEAKAKELEDASNFAIPQDWRLEAQKFQQEMRKYNKAQPKEETKNTTLPNFLL